MRKRSEVAASAAAQLVDTIQKQSGTTHVGEPAKMSAEQAGAELQVSLSAKPERPLFVSANKGSGVHPDFERIVETIYQVDAFKDYEDLEKNLEVGDQRGDYKTLNEALDKAERRARRAHALYLGAKLERARWELDSEVVMARMRADASEDLEEEKGRGERKKAITNDDVRARIAEKFPDEWRHQELKRVKLKGTEEHLERLADLWKVRCFTLSTMLSNLRK